MGAISQWFSIVSSGNYRRITPQLTKIVISCTISLGLKQTENDNSHRSSASPLLIAVDQSIVGIVASHEYI